MYRYNKGGRRRIKAPDPGGAARAMAIALRLQYATVHQALAKARAKALKGWARVDRTGLSLVVFDDVLRRYGWIWSFAPKISGRRARVWDLPDDQVVIACQARHFVAVVHGMPNDTRDYTDKMVYGYWFKPVPAPSLAPIRGRRISKNGNSFLTD